MRPRVVGRRNGIRRQHDGAASGGLQSARAATRNQSSPIRRVAAHHAHRYNTSVRRAAHRYVAQTAACEGQHEPLSCSAPSVRPLLVFRRSSAVCRLPSAFVCLTAAAPMTAPFATVATRRLLATAFARRWNMVRLEGLRQREEGEQEKRSEVNGAGAARRVAAAAAGWEERAERRTAQPASARIAQHTARSTRSALPSARHHGGLNSFLLK